MTADRGSSTREVVVSAVGIGGGQVAIVLAQLVYGALTGRALSPGAFGAFAIALSATGVLGVLLTAGISTFVLSRRDLPAGHVHATTVVAVASGVIAGSVMFFGAESWSRLWQAPGAESATRWLSLLCLFTSPAAVQLSLLRREHLPIRDAVAQAVPTLVGFLVGGTVVLATRAPLSLVVAPIATSGLGLLMAFILRRQRFERTRPTGFRSLMLLHRKISVQSLVFLLYTSTPLWVVSLVATERQVGFFNRGLVIPMMVSVALSTAINRSVQPYYRHLRNRQQVQSVLSDVIVVAASVALPVFTGIAVLSYPLVTAWLGAGWTEAASVVPPLALGYGIFVVYSVMANAAEFLGHLAEVRASQLAMLPVVMGIGGFGVLRGEPGAANYIMAAIGVVGFVVLAYVLGRSGVLVPMDVFGLVLKVIAVAIACGLATLFCSWCAQRVGPGTELLQLLFGAMGGIAMVVALVPAQPVWKVAQRRGLVKRRKGR